MPVLLIAYDLNDEDLRPPITEVIKSEWPDWIQLSESAYAIKTIHPPKKVYQALREMIDEDDYLYVVRLGKPFTGRGPKEDLQWLRENLR